MVTPTWRHWTLLLYLSLAWGLAFMAIAIGLEVFLPVTIVWARLSLGAIVMLAVMFLMGKRLPALGIWWWRMLVLATTGNMLPFFLISWSEQSISSSEAGLLMALMPITILVAGHYFLENERFTRLRLGGVILGFGGVVLLVGGDLMLGAQDRIAGQTAAILATFSYASNAIYARRLPTYDAVTVAAGSLTLGAVCLAGPVFWLQDWSAPTQNPQAWVAVGLLGVFATGFATWVYFTIISEVGPGFLSTINYLIPGIAFIAGIGFMAESSAWPQWVALLLILLGVWLIKPRGTHD